MSPRIRRVLLALPIGLAIGVPYLMLGESLDSTRNTIKSWFTGFGARQSATADVAASDTPPESASGIMQQPPVTDLGQVLNFTVTPNWVLSRWPQVTTTRAADQFEGLRVTLVTGTRPQDVAGSLTYYFDKQRQLRRIALQGLTGDPRYLVSLATRYFHLQRESIPGIEVYVARWNGTPVSALVVRHKPMLNAAELLGRAEIQLELNRAGNYVRLSPDLQRELAVATGQPVPPSATSQPPKTQTAKAENKPKFQMIPGGGIGTLFSGY